MMMPVLASTEPGFFQKLIFGGDAASLPGASSDAMFMMIFWFSVFFFVLLMVLMVFFVIKYRRRPGVPAQVSPHHSTLLEIFWTVVPSSSMLVFFVLGFQGYAEKMVVPDSAMELKIDAWKWQWQATYPNGANSPETKPISYHKDPVTGVVTKGLDYPIFYIPEDTDVRLKMISSDVIHSFWIPAFRTKMDIMPNRYTGYGFHTPKLTADDLSEDGSMIARDLTIFCAEYCGDEHSRMAATLRVVPRDVYEDKLESWAVELPPVELGKVIFKTMCASCHKVEPVQSTGPTWAQAKLNGLEFGYGYDVQLTDGTKVARDDNYYRESIIDPNSKVVDGFLPVMTAFGAQLDEKKIDAVIAYIKTLSDRGAPAQEPVEGEETENEAAEPAGSHP
jgi:cytochrome c oxidase subunit 2